MIRRPPRSTLFPYTTLFRSQKASPVAQLDDAVRRLVDDLFETMRAAKGVGLAANQIGVARRVAVVDIGEDDPPPLVLINPVIVERGDEEIGRASCRERV